MKRIKLPLLPAAGILGTFLAITTTLSAVVDSPLWQLAPGARPYVTTNQSERGMAYNPATGHILLLQNTRVEDRPSIIALDAADGSEAGSLSTNGIEGGFWDLNMIGVSDDGVIYAGNLTLDTREDPYRLYRWENEQAEPQLVFEGDLSGAATITADTRYGDTISVRGSGDQTEILVGSYGTVAAVISRSDASYTAQVFQTNVPDTDTRFRSGVAWGDGDTFFGKSRVAPLRQFQLDRETGEATMILEIKDTHFPMTAAPLQVDVERRLLATIYTRAAGNPQFALVYDLDALSETLPNAALSIVPFPTTNANTVGMGALAFNDGAFFAASMNNGLIASAIPVRRPPIAIESISRDAGEVELQLRSQLPVDVAQHVLQGTNSLRDGWTDIVTDISGWLRGGRASVEIPLGDADREFYRFVARGTVEGKVIFSENFEGDTSGWTSGGKNNTWEIGVPTSGPGSAMDGDNVAATNLHGPYAFDSDAWLRSPPVDLSGAGTATLSFWDWLHTDDDVLYHRAVVSVLDAGTLDEIAELSRRSGEHTEWTERSYSLPEEALGREVVFQFLQYDLWDMQDGWYIDDVRVTTETGASWMQLENVAELDAVTVDGEEATGFSATAAGFVIDLADEGAGGDTVELAAVPLDPSAAIAFNGTRHGSGEPFVIDLNQTELPAEVTIEVTARDGATTRTYLIEIMDTSAWTNVALQKPVDTNTGHFMDFVPENAVNGVVNNANRWITAEDSVAPQWLTIDLQDTYTLVAASVANGHMTSNNLFVDSLHLQYWDGGDWVDIPGASVTGNNTRFVDFLFPDPVVTDRVRFVSDDNGFVRIIEIEIYAQ